LERSQSFPISSGELSVAFVDDRTIAEIHERFMGDPTATDVITFPADAEMDCAGEIIISVDHARTRATEMNVPFSQELSLYLVHGWLHLAGYDDKEEDDRSKMRQAEADAMAIINNSSEAKQFALSDT
jgi:probable rRNA maturation factor